MGKIGIMGGTFDPVHNAHLMIGELAMEEFGLDKILFLTGGNPPHKTERRILDARQRHRMVQAAIAGNGHFIPCDYEVKKESYCYTAETLAHFHRIYPKEQLYFIIGDDSLKNLMSWHEPETIMDLCTLLVYPRGPQNTDSLIDALKERYRCDIRRIHAPRFDISSSMLRERIRQGHTVQYMIPDSVIEIIEENHFYKESL